MAIKYGRAKHQEKVTAADLLKFPIWTMAHNSKFAEEGVRPIVNKTNVDREVHRSRVPIIAVRIEGTEIYGLADYDHENDDLSSVALLLDGKWVDAFNERDRLKFPVTFVVIPEIFGQANVRFVWKTPKGAFKRSGGGGRRTKR
jgi:hypothetical protein